MILACKYRPKKLNEVVGQPVVVQTLSNALTQKRLHHAYLFAGCFGCGKCVSPDTIIWTTQGLKRIKLLVPNENGIHNINCHIYDETGVGSSSSGYYESDAQTICLETREGFRIEATPEHPIRVWTDNGLIWKQVREINQGDWLPIVRNDFDFTVKKDTVNVPWKFSLEKYLKKFGDSKLVQCKICGKYYGNLSTHLGTHDLSSEDYLAQYPGESLVSGKSLQQNCLKSFQDLVLPSSVPIGFARLCGYILSEGGISNNRVFVTNSDPDVIEDVKEALSLFGIDPKVSFDKRTEGTVTVSLNYIKIAEAWRNLGFGGNSYEKRVPDFILGCPSNWIREFLRAYFEGDGGVDGQSVSCCSRSPGLVRDIQTILLYNGIISSIRKSQKGATNGKNIKNNAYTLRIYGKDIRTFAQKFGFISRRKEEQLQTLLSGLGNNPNKDVIPFIQDRLVELKQRLPISSNGCLIIYGKNVAKLRWPGNIQKGLSQHKNVTYANLEDCLEYFCQAKKHLGNHSLLAEVEQMINELSLIIRWSYFFSPVISIQKGRNDVIDISKEGEDHSFFANGMINHNTSTARILAASENCGATDDILHPCGSCELCRAIFAGTHTDVSEIDAASNAGKVEQVRELKNAASYAPIDGAKSKYYIIDECLPADALVSMSDGSQVPIGKLVEEGIQGQRHGDEVCSRDVETGETIQQSICRYIKISNDKQMYEVSIKDPGGKIRTVKITGNHNVFVKNEGKIKAQDLQVGQKIFLRFLRDKDFTKMNEQREILGEIISIEPVQCDDDFVYNLEVESSNSMNKNYFADGVLVSNCHRMSPAAEEALLKILEEPPKRVRFVLCTTEYQHMRSTILSRCQVHEFKKIYWREIARHLEMVAKQEKLNCQTEALNLCAKIADGSMRNGLQNLEKLINFAGGKELTGKLAQEAFGTASDLIFYSLIGEIAKEGAPDATSGYRIINDLLVSGMGASQILEGISEVLRNILVGVSASACGDLILVAEEAKNRLKELLRLFKPKMQALLGIMEGLSKVRIAVDQGQTLDIALQMWFLQSIFKFQKGG